MANEDRILRMADEVEIRNVIAKLAIHADDGDMEAFVSALAEDVHWENRSQPERPPIIGRTAFINLNQQARSARGMGAHSCHSVPTSVITVTGDTATAKSYLFFYPDARSTAEPACKIYNDQFVRTPGGWKLSIRYIDPI